MKFLISTLFTFILFNLLPKFTYSDVSFEIRSDIEISIRLSLRPSPVKTIQILMQNAEQYCKNFKNIVAVLRPKPMTVQGITNLNNLDNQTKAVCIASQKFFSNDEMTVWYNKARRILENNYVFTKMKEIIDNFLKAINPKKAPRCWNKNRASVQNITQYYVATIAYIRMESFLKQKFIGYKNESVVFLEDSKKIETGNSPTFFVSNYDKVMDLHKRWMTDITQLSPEVNQTAILVPIFDDAFNMTLTNFEQALTAVVECTTVKKEPKAG